MSMMCQTGCQSDEEEVVLPESLLSKFLTDELAAPDLTRVDS
jgi:hypothetical protein